ncbi:30S ribosomal protein S18 [bacterium]|nr:30S ribosomal protein S18 [bacterium]
MRKKCFLCGKKIQAIDFTEKELLSQFMTESGKILPRKKLRLCSKHRRQIKKAIKRARNLGLLPFVVK